ncbi:MAG: ABC transporter permease [Chloroflexi bacterium]|nr:ABC transporter permease [Chloroflexota bacterium]
MNDTGSLIKKIIAIGWKDILIGFSSATEWLFFLILPIVFTLILAGGTGAQADARIRLVVVDQAQSPLSADLLAALERSETIRPDVQPLNQAEDEFKQRTVSAVLVIPPEFTLQQLEGGSVTLELRQQPNNLNALVASRAVMAIAGSIGSVVDIANSSVNAAESLAPFASQAEKAAFFDESLQAAQSEMSAAPARLRVANAATQDQIEYDPRVNSSAGQLITWVFIPLLGISAMFAYERQKGTLRRLLTTPTQKATYLLGTIAGQSVRALVQTVLLVGFGMLVMHVNWGQSLPALAVMLVAFILAAAALGTTLGTFVKTEGQASGLSIMLGMVMALLGGCWYPIELFPQFVQTAVKIFPTTWAMQGLLDVAAHGGGLSA